MKLIEALLMDMMIRPFRTAFLLFTGGFLCGLIAVILVYFLWLHTVFRAHIEREMDKRFVYQVYQQRTCVAKGKMTRECVEWTQ